MVSAADLAKRAFVVLLKSLADVYGVTLNLSRDSPAEQIRNAYRQVSRKAHPDRGGDPEEQKALNNAHDAWSAAAKQKQKHGGDKRSPQAKAKAKATVTCVKQLKQTEEKEKGFRFQSLGFALPRFARLRFISLRSASSFGFAWHCFASSLRFASLGFARLGFASPRSASPRLAPGFASPRFARPRQCRIQNTPPTRQSQNAVARECGA